MAAFMGERECYFSTLILSLNSLKSLEIDRKRRFFSSWRRVYGDPFSSETSHSASWRQEDTDNVAIDKGKCNDEKGGYVSRAMLIKRIILRVKDESIKKIRKTGWETLTHHRKLIYGRDFSNLNGVALLVFYYNISDIIYSLFRVDFIINVRFIMFLPNAIVFKQSIIIDTFQCDFRCTLHVKLVTLNPRVTRFSANRANTDTS